MQSLLGCGVYFKPFIKDYALISQPLYNSVRKDFNWNDPNAISKLKMHFQDFKNGINQAQMLHYLDYSLEWILQTDASIAGLGGVLLQRLPNDKLVPIVFKFKSTFSCSTKLVYYPTGSACSILLCQRIIIFVIWKGIYCSNRSYQS